MAIKALFFHNSFIIITYQNVTYINIFDTLSFVQRLRIRVVPARLELETLKPTLKKKSPPESRVSVSEKYKNRSGIKTGFNFQSMSTSSPSVCVSAQPGSEMSFSFLGVQGFVTVASDWFGGEFDSA